MFAMLPLTEPIQKMKQNGDPHREQEKIPDAMKNGCFKQFRAAKYQIPAVILIKGVTENHKNSKEKSWYDAAYEISYRNVFFHSLISFSFYIMYVNGLS